MSYDYKISKLTMGWIMIAMVVICFCATFKITNDYWKVELVKRGYAKWTVKDDKGTVQWEWVAHK